MLADLGTPTLKQVIAGARATLRALPPAAILAEYTPGVAERHRQWEIMPRYPASLTDASEAGYHIWHLGGSGTKNAIERCGGCKWSSLSLPGLREVSKGTLRAEAMNAANMAAAQGAFSVPWDLHPRSLHAEFSHNTDVLLTLGAPRGHATIPNLGEVGIFEASEYGLGGGICRDVLRDGTEQEMVGRLCVLPGRNDSILAARCKMAAKKKQYRDLDWVAMRKAVIAARDKAVGMGQMERVGPELLYDRSRLLGSAGCQV